MKVLVLSNDLWALAKKKIQAELHHAETDASLVRGYKLRHPGDRLWNESRIRKRHIEALKLAKIINE